LDYLKVAKSITLSNKFLLKQGWGWRITADACTLVVFSLGWLAIVNLNRPPFFLIFLVLAGLLDGLDGALARRSGGPSFHGAVLDVLADATTFGLAPLILSVYQAKLSGALLWVGATIYMAAAIWRLIRSARQYLQKPSGYIGLPMPETGNLLAIFALTLPPAGFFATLVGLSALAVSRLIYPSLPWLWKHERYRLVVTALITVGLTFFHYTAGLLVGLLIYTLYPWLAQRHF
jgi:phosphatidylserine synthase